MNRRAFILAGAAGALALVTNVAQAAGMLVILHLKQDVGPIWIVTVRNSAKDVLDYRIDTAIQISPTRWVRKYPQSPVQIIDRGVEEYYMVDSKGWSFQIV